MNIDPKQASDISFDIFQLQNIEKTMKLAVTSREMKPIGREGSARQEGQIWYFRVMVKSSTNWQWPGSFRDGRILESGIIEIKLL